MGDVIRFETNVPQEVALKYAGGKEVEGRFGPQVLYMTTDGNTMYFAPVVADKIDALNVKPGERIQICKREVKNGRKNGIEWAITRVDPPANGNGVALQNSPAPAQPVASQPMSKEPKQQTNGNASPEIVHTQTSQAMTGCLIAAIDALRTAQQYAEAKGLSFQFNEDEVVRTASTLYIQHCRLIEQRMRGASCQ